MKIIIDPQKCRSSGDCVLICAQKAISIENGLAVIDESQCDLDGMCIAACPHGAINFAAE
ncbi:4Fe-4S dicluster domain-containing protein [Thermodesulfobacteriota bacterium]